MANEKTDRRVSDLLAIAVSIGLHFYAAIGKGMTTQQDFSKRDERATQEDRLLFGAALGVSVAGFFQLAQSDDLSGVLEMSFVCFAISIPFTAARVYISTLELDRKRKVRSELLRLLDTVGMLTTLAGLVGIFWHASTPTGILFLCLSVFSFLLAVRVYFLLR